MIDALFAFWRDGGGNPLVEMATGTGKSLVIAELARCLMASGSRRILVLTHVKELIDQNLKALLKVWPKAPIGINSAGFGQRDYDAPIVFAAVQSIFRSPELLGRRNLVAIDEAHMVPRGDTGMYHTTINVLRNIYPDMRVAGFTATPSRLDSGRLDEGEDRLFDKIVFRYGIDQGIAEGWLAPLIAKAPHTEIDVRGVHRRAGELVAAELERAADLVVEEAADEIVERGRDRRSCLVFCCGVEHAKHVRDALRERGVSAETITGDTPGRDRDDIIAQFRAGDIWALTGCNVFTTGFDVPQVDLIAMMRPTLSTGLYVQMVGRGTRRADGKTNAMILDFGGNVRRHGPVDRPVINTAKFHHGGEHDDRDGTAAIDMKVCPDCRTYVPETIEQCPECGHKWSIPRIAKHDGKAGDLAILSTDAEVFPVLGISSVVHQKPGRPDSLRVNYRIARYEFAQVSEWLTIWHHTPGSHIGKRLRGEWLSRLRAGAPRLVPPDAETAAAVAPVWLRVPTHVRLNRDGTFTQVVPLFAEVEAA